MIKPWNSFNPEKGNELPKDESEPSSIYAFLTSGGIFEKKDFIKTNKIIDSVNSELSESKCCIGIQWEENYFDPNFEMRQENLAEYINFYDLFIGFGNPLLFEESLNIAQKNERDIIIFQDISVKCKEIIGDQNILYKYYSSGDEFERRLQVFLIRYALEKKILGNSSNKIIDVFICYSSKDKDSVKKIVNDFKKRGITYWFAEESVQYGDYVAQKIENGLNRSKCIMPCLSNNFKKSNWAMAEYGAFLNYEIRENNFQQKVIPIVLDDLREDYIPMLLRDKKRVSYNNKNEYKNFLKYLEEM
ncbi:MAG: toll/interleukin-1 receptor domain-containing protein [Methanothrix sp.]|nr:toll/interleukin-1 receptor domain-containing protein [Methanothrix sp.]